MFKNWVFNDKRPTENVIVLLRRHPIVLMRGLVEILGVLLVVNLVLLFVKFTIIETLIILAVLILIIIVLSFYHLYLWYNDVYVLTNERLIDVDQFSLFNRTISETFLDLVEDVKVESKGLLPTVFNYGNVTIQTAGAKENLVLETLSNPFVIQQRITKAIYDYRNELNKSGNDNEFVKLIDINK